MAKKYMLLAASVHEFTGYLPPVENGIKKFFKISKCSNFQIESETIAKCVHLVPDSLQFCWILYD